MVYLKKNLVIFLAVLFTAVLFIPSAFAYSSGDGYEDSGGAPYGVHGDGKAFGTKLYGAVSIAMPSLNLNGQGTVSYIIRLRNNNELKVFHGNVSVDPETGDPLNYQNIEGVTAAILEAVTDEVLGAFGFDPAASVLVIKSVDEFMDDVVEEQDVLECQTDDPNAPNYADSCSTHDAAAYAMMDIVFAAN